ncbi:MAG: NADP-dependent oxidoreductase [Actinomycetia bacterium]|nr:NADP-dependent oxidoreductase [Actinomycetes bacterium]
MKAVIIPRFGGPEVLEVADLPKPQPGPGEVRIRVAAATVNPTDISLRSGRRPTNLPPPYIPGMELAGTVDVVGPGVSDRRPGEQVMAIVLPLRPQGGAQAELVVVPAESVVPVPDRATLVEAATLPMNGLTVRRALDLLALPAGATLAVTGAAGAVGGYAIQLGKVAGLRVVADAAPADEALVRSLGADIVVPRGHDVARAIRTVVPDGVDALIDAAVQGPTVLPAVRDGGQVAAVRQWTGGTERGIRIHQVAVSDYARNQAALDELRRLAGAGKLTLRVAETFLPERVAEAHRKLEAGGVRGRLVLVF